MSPWNLSHRADISARLVADRHYNRQNVGADGFAPPGRCLVLKRPGAFWITSYPYAQYTKHEWAGAMVCSAFRRECKCEAKRPKLCTCGPVASELIIAALACTVWKSVTDPMWHEFPKSHDGYAMISFVDPSKTRRKRDPGRCFRRAGFVEIGKSKSGLVALGIKTPFPAAEPPNGTTMDLF